MWLDNAPAPQDVNPLTCNQGNQTGCVYEDDKLLAYVLDVVAKHDPATPLFLMLSTHSIHEPYEVPDAYLKKFAFVDVEVRQYYVAMVNHIDDVVGNLTAALKAKGMWDETLFVSTSDNGGPLAKVIRFPQLYYLVGGLAAAGFAVLLALRPPAGQPGPKSARPPRTPPTPRR